VAVIGQATKGDQSPTGRALALPSCRRGVNALWIVVQKRPFFLQELGFGVHSLQ